MCCVPRVFGFNLLLRVYMLQEQVTEQICEEYSQFFESANSPCAYKYKMLQKSRCMCLRKGSINTPRTLDPWG